MQLNANTLHTSTVRTMSRKLDLCCFLSFFALCLLLSVASSLRSKTNSFSFNNRRIMYYARNDKSSSYHIIDKKNPEARLSA